MAAAAAVGGIYPKQFMLQFVQRLYSVMLNSPPKVFLYQAGSMSAAGSGFLHPVSWTMKQTLGRKLNLMDNDAAIGYIGAQKSIPFIVTRAGVLEEGEPRKHAVLSHWVSQQRITVFVLCRNCMFSYCTNFFSFRLYRGFQSPLLTWQLAPFVH